MCVYATPSGLVLRRKMVTRALAGAAGFAVLFLALPISEAVALCARWMFGPGQLSPGQASAAFAIMAMLYAALPVALVGRIRGDGLSWLEACFAACLFTALVGPLLFVQAASDLSLLGLGALACGAWVGEWLGSRRQIPR